MSSRLVHMCVNPTLLDTARGGDRLVAQLDVAIASADPVTVVRQVEQVLVAAIADPDIALPAAVYEPVADHYARRELYRSPAHGYSVIAMTWGPGQGTPLHDHDGCWCVEGVWEGSLHITPYRLMQRDGERFRFQPCQTLTGTVGSAGNLIPPDEHHVLRNASDTQVAVSLHVYQQPLQRCDVFEPQPDDLGWYLRREVILATDGIAAAVS